MTQRVRIVVTGRVQGVSFRAYTQRTAASLGLQGYVRNLPTGEVEIVAEGDAERLADLLRWARRGPSLAHVEDATVEYAPPTHELRGFAIRY